MKSMDNIGEWNINVGEKISIGDFNNVSDIKKFGFHPGQRGDNAVYTVNEEAKTIERKKIVESDYQYIYKGIDYFYGIKNDGNETIAHLENDNIAEIISGAGHFLIRNNNGEAILTVVGIDSFETKKIDNYDAVSVKYTCSGNYGYVKTAEITYVFKERCIAVDAVLSIEDIKEDIPNGACYIQRKYLNDGEALKRRVSYDWVYPEDNDFAYKVVDALVFSDEYDDFSFYTCCRDKNSTNQFMIYKVSNSLFSLNVPKNTKTFNYEYHMDLAFEKKDIHEGYKALFKSKNMDFAAGVVAINDDHTTMFAGKDISLNINVLNITESDINYCVKFNIIDYYGNIVDEGTYYTNILTSGNQANRNLSYKMDKYGMYYLNLYVSTQDYEYRECYPFALVEDYKFKYRDDNPFGICAIHTETEGEGESTANIVDKMGLSIVRIGCTRLYSSQKLKEMLKKHNVKRYADGYAYNKSLEKVDEFKQRIHNETQNWPDGRAYYLMANETDSPYKCNYETAKDYIENVFKPCCFDPAYDVISHEHPEMLDRVIWQSNCHGPTQWFEAYKESGIWDKSGLIDIHSYSSPTGPDKVFSNQRESMYANLFSNEYAVERWKRITKRYGEKRMMVGETGYPSTPLDKMEDDIRTVADFNTRIVLFFLEAGAEDILFYCLFDRTSYFVGSSRWNEMHFGAWYNYDYYGTFMPKPWAVAYANITRRFDGYKSCSINSKYNENELKGTLRAFDVVTADTKFTALWSNIYKLPNTTAKGRVSKTPRIPMPAWEDRWVKKETRIFDTIGDTVKVVDIMGNSTEYKNQNGKVELEISGSPIFVYGIK